MGGCADGRTAPSGVLWFRRLSNVLIQKRLQIGVAADKHWAALDAAG